MHMLMRLEQYANELRWPVDGLVSAGRNEVKWMEGKKAGMQYLGDTEVMRKYYVYTAASCL